MSWVTPNDIDGECLKLCTAINRIDGIETHNSCCGHGEKPYRIWFTCKSLELLPPLVYYFDEYHSFNGWRIYIRTDGAMSFVGFMIEGPVGKVSYMQSEGIAKLLNNYLNELEDK